MGAAGENKMKIAVLSGKGGTGKTLVAVNLAVIAKQSVYIDCDVEEPNGYLFLRPKKTAVKPISVKVPVVDPQRCVGCRTCVDFCKFNALAYIQNKPIVFTDICHSCGGCVLFCIEKALSETEKLVGEIRYGMTDRITVATGVLNTGEASGIPIIKQLIAEAGSHKEDLIFMDCPPGSACIVMESIKDADYCVLVAEPTLFGVHNLEMVYNLVKLFNKPYGAVLNKCLPEENPAEVFCEKNGIAVLGKIPFDAKLGNINSNAKIAVRESKEYKKVFKTLLETIQEAVGNEAIAGA